MTVGQRWRRRRNLAIYLAHRGGMSHRMLADVFDLSRARVQAIIASFPVPRAETGRPPIPEPARRARLSARFPAA